MDLSFFKRKKNNLSKKESKENLKEEIKKKIHYIEVSKKRPENLVESLYGLILLTSRQYTKTKSSDLLDYKPYLKEKKWLLQLIDEITEYNYSEYTPTKEEVCTMVNIIKKHL